MPSPRRRGAGRPLLLFLVMLPFWTNYLIRTYAWIVLLNREGLINRGCSHGSGWIGEPLPLLYNEFAVVAGPGLQLPALRDPGDLRLGQRLDPRLREASRDLGARRLAPPSGASPCRSPLPGIAAGAVFVFVLSIGNFVTPDLLGGGKLQMVGNLIYDQFLTARDWPFGATLAVLLIALMMLPARRCRRWPSSRRRAAPMSDAMPTGAGCGSISALVYLFLYLPIAVLVVLSLQREPACRPPGPASRSNGTASSPAIRRSCARRCNIADRGRCRRPLIATVLGTAAGARASSARPGQRRASTRCSSRR